MALLKLNDEWTDLMRKYEGDHSDPRNQACHKVGIPLIAASLPIGATIVGLPLAAAMFTTGWAFQFVGHYYEGRKPAFADDLVGLLVGPMFVVLEMLAPLGLFRGLMADIERHAGPTFIRDLAHPATR